MHRFRPHALAGVTLAVLAALALAACGSSSSSSSSSSASAGASGGASFARFQSCLKSHGVTLPAGRRGSPPSDSGTAPGGAPPTSGGGRHRRGFFGGGTRNGKDAAAFSACRKDLPAGAGRSGRGRFGRGRGAAQFSAATLARFSACVKQHGYTLPKPNTSGSGPVYPRSIESNRTFQKASSACRSILRPSGSGAPPAP